MQSDGYQTYNDQRRDAFSAKYQYTASDQTTVTAFSSLMELNSNTPDQKGATRAQIAQFGDNFLMTGDPASPLYYGYNFYNIPTDLRVRRHRATSSATAGPSTTRSTRCGTTTSRTTTARPRSRATSGTDKLNAIGRSATCCRCPTSPSAASSAPDCGPSSPRPTATRRRPIHGPGSTRALPNFHEIVQHDDAAAVRRVSAAKMGNADDHARGEVRVLQAGLHPVRRQRQDRGQPERRAVRAARGRTTTRGCRRSTRITCCSPYWSVYGAVRQGPEHPADQHLRRAGGTRRRSMPKPILSDTAEVGSVWKARRATLDVDFYHIKLQNDYSSTFDPETGDTSTT